MPFSKKKILVVDDNKTLIMYVSMLLKRMGFEVFPAANGMEALKLINMIDTSLILLDLTMPVMDGITTLKKLKENSSTSMIPVVILSIDSEESLIKECAGYGSSGYLTKPIQLDRLHEVLQECIFSPMGIKRKYLRSAYTRKVRISCHGEVQDLYAETLSEGGIFVRKSEPLRTGTDLEVRLTLNGHETMLLKGTVIYTKDNFGDLCITPLGMAIEFKNMTGCDSKKLKTFISELLAKDIIDGQEEKIITIDGHK